MDLIEVGNDINKQAASRMFRYDGQKLLYYLKMYHAGDISFPRFCEFVGDLERVHRDDILREVGTVTFPDLPQRAREAGL